MADWLVPIVRIQGEKGEEFPIETQMKTIIPQERGRLFVFVNDAAVVGLRSLWDSFLGSPNHTVSVTVTKCDVSIHSQPRTALVTVSDCAKGRGTQP
jgi:hypothetical protein